MEARLDWRPSCQSLGAIVSYALTHDVPRVRVVFCDAATYDQGYMSPDALADSVKVHGRVERSCSRPSIFWNGQTISPKMVLFSSSPTVNATASRSTASMLS